MRRDGNEITETDKRKLREAKIAENAQSKLFVIAVTKKTKTEIQKAQ